jgi:hypothetical protein
MQPLEFEFQDAQPLIGVHRMRARRVGLGVMKKTVLVENATEICGSPIFVSI